MSIDAVLIGFASAVIFGLFSGVCVLVLHRLGWPRGRAIAALLAVQLAVLILVPPPLVLLARAELIKIHDPGHIAARLLGPYFLGSLVVVIVCVLVMLGKRTTPSNAPDGPGPSGQARG
jgi:hypothetical protein